MATKKVSKIVNIAKVNRYFVRLVTEIINMEDSRFVCQSDGDDMLISNGFFAVRMPASKLIVNPTFGKPFAFVEMFKLPIDALKLRTGKRAYYDHGLVLFATSGDKSVSVAYNPEYLKYFNDSEYCMFAADSKSGIYIVDTYCDNLVVGIIMPMRYAKEDFDWAD